MASDVTWSFGAGPAAWSIVVHGGAGDIAADSAAARADACKRAAGEGRRILAAGGTATDAVQRAVELLEDDPLFNAGTGACLTRDGTLELDASIMEGSGLRAGGVCALPAFRHPIAIARAVMDENAHVLYAGPGAERFALEHAFVRATDADMTTPAARARWQEWVSGGGAGGDGGENWAGGHGTVGAVARDTSGLLAAATSTGGRMFKRPGRVGDSPILGAGTYAENGAGACSNTGDGEAILRLVLAKSACEWVRGGMHPEDAARGAVRLLADRLEGAGGTILVDSAGRAGLARTTRSMAWGFASATAAEPAGGT